MKDTWIIDVLGDLRTFAQLNGLNHLADELDRTAQVARIELASQIGATSSMSMVNGAGTGDTSWSAAAGRQS